VLAVLALGYSFFATVQKKYKAGLMGFKGYRFGRDDILLVVTTLLVILAISFPYIRGVTLAGSGANYNGRGSVANVDAAARKITLKHEVIKGLMPAMTMEFRVKSAEMLDGIREGNRVRFTISPQGADFVVEKIEKEQ
jgi:Cu/Ag efflux protein CusF